MRPPDTERVRFLRFWLSKEAATKSSEPHRRARLEIRRLALRIPVCLALGAPSFLLAAHHPYALAGYAWALGHSRYAGLCLLALSAFTACWAALPVHESALRGLFAPRAADVRVGSTHLDSALASLACFVALLVATLPVLRDLDQLSLTDLTLPPAITLFALLLTLAERLVRRAARSALHGIARLSPSHALRVGDDGCEEWVPLEVLAVGERFRVAARELIALDGVVLEGRSSVKEQRITGEPLPVDKRKGAAVIGGTRNGRGVLTIRVTRTKRDGVLAVISRTARRAEQTSAALENTASRVSAWLTLTVLSAAGGQLTLAILTGAPSVRTALLSCLTLLVVAIPGALSLAVFLAFRIGLGRAVRVGLMVPSATALNALSRIDVVVVGKSGTLTEARPRVISVVPAEACSEAQLLSLAGGLLSASARPFAQAVLTRAETLAAPAAPVADVVELPGCGFLGRLAAERVGLGNHKLLTLLGAHDVTLEGKAQALCDHGQTVVFVVSGGQVCGLIGCVDPVKLTTRDALRELDDDGVRTVLCTADARRTAQHLANQLGIQELAADTPPAEKVALVRRLSAQGAKVAFASRSPQEAPAMERAQLAIGLCLAAQLDERWPEHTAPACEQPGSVRVDLVHGDLAAIARAVALSRAVARSARRSLWLGLGYHALALPLAAGIFGPAWHISVAAGAPLAQLVALSGLLLLVSHALLLRRTPL